MSEVGGRVCPNCGESGYGIGLENASVVPEKVVKVAE